MRALNTAATLLMALAMSAQSTGDVLTWKKGASLADLKTYTTPVNSSLFSLNSSGNFALLAQSNFITTANFNGLGDARWQLLDADLTSIAALSTTGYGRGFLTLADAAAARTYIGAGSSSFDGAFSSLSGKPTTIGGYGITDFNSLGDARWSLLGHTHAASDITSGVFNHARLGTGGGGSTKFLREDGTWQTVSSGGGTWGSITGTLSAQTDLQTELDNINSGLSVLFDDYISESTSSQLSNLPSGTKATPSTSDYGVLDDMAASGVKKGFTLGSLPISTATQTALDGQETRIDSIRTNYLPLSGGTMDSGAQITMGNGSRMQEGTTDLSLGAAGGISLRCSVDYELNYQAGRLTAYEPDGSTERALEMGSPISFVDAADATTTINNLLPSQNALSDKYLTTNGTDVSWAAVSSALRAGELVNGRTIAITGDLAYTSPTFDGSANVSAAGTLATVNSNVGSFGSSTTIPSFTVNGKGLITAASTNAVVAPAGTLTGTTLASGVTASSLTSAAGGTFGTAAYVNTGTSSANVPTVAQADARYEPIALKDVVTNFTFNSASYTDLTGLTVTLAANTSYQITILVNYSCPTSGTGIGLSVTASGSPTSRTLMRDQPVAATGTVRAQISADDGGAIGVSSTGTTELTASLWGNILTSGSTCTIQPRVARGGTSATITISTATIIAHPL